MALYAEGEVMMFDIAITTDMTARALQARDEKRDREETFVADRPSSSTGSACRPSVATVRSHQRELSLDAWARARRAP